MPLQVPVETSVVAGGFAGLAEPVTVKAVRGSIE